MFQILPDIYFNITKELYIDLDIIQYFHKD